MRVLVHNLQKLSVEVKHVSAFGLIYQSDLNLISAIFSIIIKALLKKDSFVLKYFRLIAQCQGTLYIVIESTSKMLPKYLGILA